MKIKGTFQAKHLNLKSKYDRAMLSENLVSCSGPPAFETSRWPRQLGLTIINQIERFYDLAIGDYGLFRSTMSGRVFNFWIGGMQYGLKGSTNHRGRKLIVKLVTMTDSLAAFHPLWHNVAIAYAVVLKKSVYFFNY